jgi:hypothetical protein
MGTPFPPQEPFGEDAIRDVDEQADEHVEEVQREHAAEENDSGHPSSEGVSWWRRLFRRS